MRKSEKLVTIGFIAMILFLFSPVFFGIGVEQFGIEIGFILGVLVPVITGATSYIVLRKGYQIIAKEELGEPK